MDQTLVQVGFGSGSAIPICPACLECRFIYCYPWQRVRCELLLALCFVVWLFVTHGLGLDTIDKIPIFSDICYQGSSNELTVLLMPKPSVDWVIFISFLLSHGSGMPWFSGNSVCSGFLLASMGCLVFTKPNFQ